MQALYQLSYSPAQVCYRVSPAATPTLPVDPVHHQIVSVGVTVTVIAGTSSRGPGLSQAVTNE
jgi:hypothetical protein